ncbi:hypothetical protein [Xylanimonas allomyrinae]|uniref:hypothetical protein n=1 Tax=Xylanimonas allomyrinae TaxID=2509459 RepID=UPI0013A61F4E|nr:hypothetical protein [Xylanimonas allomyrinae]
MCAPWDLKCKAGEAVTNAATDWLNNLATSVAEAVGSFVATLGTLWVSVPTPQIATNDEGAPSGVVGFVQNHLLWYVGALAVLSVIIGGARMAWERRADPGRDLLQSLLTLVVVSGAGLAVISLATTAADKFSVWIIDESLACEDLAANETCFARNVSAMLGLSGMSGVGAVVQLAASLIALLASLIQIVMMLIRGGMLIVLAGVFPLTASFTNTETGRTWFKKCIGWLIAYILYKPTAAIIYATAFQLTGSGVDNASWSGVGEGLLKVLTGITLMCMALIALPALMRFVAPMTSATAGGAGAGVMAAGAVTAGATGAMQVASKTFGSFSGGGGGGGNGGGEGKDRDNASGANPNSAGKSSGDRSAPGTDTAPAAGGGAGAAAAGGGAGAGAAAAGGGAGAAAATGGTSLVVQAGVQAAGAVKSGIEQAANTAAGAASDTTEDNGGGPSGSGR